MNHADKRKLPSPKSSKRRRDRGGVAKQRRVLYASDERYRYLFQNNPQPMLVYDLETLAFLDVNEAIRSVSRSVNSPRHPRFSS